jgi:hypothetical protein
VGLIRVVQFLYRNSLSIAFLVLLIFSWAGQAYTGWRQHNDLLQEYDQPPTAFTVYLGSGHFIQATFENWESEFLQMALFVLFTVFLRQEGSSESKPVDEHPLDADAELEPKWNSPWPVRKGGVWLFLYSHSLSIALILLFVCSFWLHWYGSWLDFNEKQLLEGKAAISMSRHLVSSKLWFESFQNWQSEFLSIFAIIFLSIYFRERGSSQSKKVNEPNYKTD